MPVVKAHTEFRRDWRAAPLAYWVHREAPPLGWYGAKVYEPPAPTAHGRKGFAFLVVSYGRHDLEFSSPAQLAHFIDVLARAPLPTTRALSKLRGASVGPNGHWLSRLPAVLKTPKERSRLVAALESLPKDVWVPTR